MKNLYSLLLLIVISIAQQMLYFPLLLVEVSTHQGSNAKNPGRCTLCIDGSAPPFLDNPVFEFTPKNSTCSDIAKDAAVITVKDMRSYLTCRRLQDVGLSNCGCETPEELKTGCTLCPGGNELLPDPLKQVIPHVTCSGIASVVERFEEEECRAYQQVIGGMCGCPDAPTTRTNGQETCRICNDREVDFPAFAVDTFGPGIDVVPCVFFEIIANQYNETSCENFQLQRKSCCKSPPKPTPPSNLAELCAINTISTDLEAYAVCSNACAEATCCSNTCKGVRWCRRFLPCRVLDTIEPPPEPGADGGGDGENSTNDGPPAPPSDLVELCQEDTISSSLDAYLGCVNVCVQGQCCLNSTCSSSDTTCSQYLPCTVLDRIEAPQPPGKGEPTRSGGENGNETLNPSETTPPTGEEGAKDTGDNEDSGLFVFFRLVLSILLAIAAVADFF